MKIEGLEAHCCGALDGERENVAAGKGGAGAGGIKITREWKNGKARELESTLEILNDSV